MMVCNGGLASLGPPTGSARVAAYLNDWNRLSNEFGDTIGCAPATMPSLAGAAAGGGSASAGFRGGRAAACFVVSGLVVSGLVVSGLGVAAAAVFGTEATWSLRLASMIFGFAGTAGCGLDAVVSAAPPRPTLRARLLKKPSDCAFGAADATRVAGAAGACARAMAAASGSSGDVTGPRGGLRWEGMVPGARESATSDRPWPSPPSDRPVLPSGSLEANTLFMPPSMPVLIRATGVPWAISLAVSA